MVSSEVDGARACVTVVAVFWNDAHHWGHSARPWVKPIDESQDIFKAFKILTTSQNAIVGSRKLEYVYIGGLSTSQALVVSPLIKILHRRFGLKMAMALGVLLRTTSLLGVSWSKETWQLYLGQGVVSAVELDMQHLSTI